MSWPSALTREQRQRREALREAKKLLRRNTTDPAPGDVLQVAEFILRGETPARS